MIISASFPSQGFNCRTNSPLEGSEARFPPGVSVSVSGTLLNTTAALKWQKGGNISTAGHWILTRSRSGDVTPGLGGRRLTSSVPCNRLDFSPVGKKKNSCAFECLARRILLALAGFFCRRISHPGPDTAGGSSNGWEQKRW